MHAVQGGKIRLLAICTYGLSDVIYCVTDVDRCRMA